MSTMFQYNIILRLLSQVINSRTENCSESRDLYALPLCYISAHPWKNLLFSITRAANCRARAGLKTAGLQKPGLQSRRAGRPGPVPIPALNLIELTPGRQGSGSTKKILKITRSDRKSTSSSFVEKSWEHTSDSK